MMVHYLKHFEEVGFHFCHNSKLGLGYAVGKGLKMCLLIDLFFEENNQLKMTH